MRIWSLWFDFILLVTLVQVGIHGFNPSFVPVSNWRWTFLQKPPLVRPSATSSEESSVAADNDTIGIQDIERHLSILEESLTKLTGRGVYDRMGLDGLDNTVKDIVENERFVLISHGTQEDPIYNFGNEACLQAFARTWEELCRTPSRESVVIRSQDEALRQELMKSVTNDGYVEGATGIRVTGNEGKFIRFVDAVVWNLYDKEGDYYGQAAFFDREKVEEINA